MDAESEMETPPHPSFLELDRVALGRGTPQAATHVKGCERCQAHLRELEEPIAVPAWALALGRPPPEPRRSSWFFPTLALAAAAGAAVVILIAPRPHPLSTTAPSGVLVAAKGAPSVALYLKRGEQVSLWDGHSEVRPGDHLRLEVAAEGLGHVLVATPGGFAQPLFSGAVDPKRPALLPTSWLVDDSPGTEALLVVLSAQPLSAEEATAAVAGHRRDAQVWTTELTLPKAAE